MLRTFGVAAPEPGEAPDLVVIVEAPRVPVTGQLRDSVDRHPAAIHLVLSHEPAGLEDVVAAVRAGADGWLHLGLPVRALRDAVLGLLRGEAALPRRAVGALLAEVRVRPRRSVRRADGRYVELTEREWQVLDRLARGLRTAQVAKELHVSDATIRGYVRTACRRLRAGDRAHAVALFVSASADVDVVIA